MYMYKWSVQIACEIAIPTFGLLDFVWMVIVVTYMYWSLNKCVF